MGLLSKIRILLSNYLQFGLDAEKFFPCVVEFLFPSSLLLLTLFSLPVQHFNLHLQASKLLSFLLMTRMRVIRRRRRRRRSLLFGYCYNGHHSSSCPSHPDDTLGFGEGFRIFWTGESVDGALEFADLTLQIFDGSFSTLHFLRLLQNPTLNRVDLLQQLIRRRLFRGKQSESGHISGVYVSVCVCACVSLTLLSRSSSDCPSVFLSVCVCMSLPTSRTIFCALSTFYCNAAFNAPKPVDILRCFYGFLQLFHSQPFNIDFRVETADLPMKAVAIPAFVL